MENILANLNQSQSEAASHTAGPLLIVAGAGTGKTTVLINRLNFLVREKGVKPENILLVTFTEKAANELSERADRILPYGSYAPWIRTFHGLGDDILRRHGIDIGLSPNYRLLTGSEPWVMLKRNFKQLELDYYRPLGNPGKFLNELYKHFSRAKDENISADKYLSYAEALRADQDSVASGIDEQEVKRQNELARAFNAYNRLLLSEDALDYADLMVETHRLFSERPHILAAYQRQFEYIMVDEFQDTNLVQYEIIKQLAGAKQNVVAVADDDQAIYKFRGASLSNIAHFRRDFPQSKLIVLTENYRSGQKILDTAYKFITNNNPNRLEVREQIDKRLLSKTDYQGEVEYWSLANEAAETKAVAEKLIALHQAGTDWSEMAVLVRANKTADRFTAEFSRRGLPYQFLSHKGLYLKPIILDIMALLRLLDNYHESSALYRVLTLKPYFIAHDELQEITRTAKERHWSLYETLKEIRSLTKLSPETMTRAESLTVDIKRLSEQTLKSPPSLIIAAAVKEVFYRFLDRDRDWIEFRLLNQFYRRAAELENHLPEARLKDFLEMIDMELEGGDTGAMPLLEEDADTIKIATIHSAKGLEYEAVFVAGLVDRKFPTVAQPDLIALPDALVDEVMAEGNSHLEEERRLFYVAMTRAKKLLVLTAARDTGGSQPKKPSRFLAEAGLLKADKLDEAEDGLEIFKDAPPTAANQPPPAPKQLSFSQLEAYRNCPLQYMFANILKLPIDDKPSTVFGKIMHATVQRFLEPLSPQAVAQIDLFGAVKDPDLSLERLLNIYNEVWTDRGFVDKDDAAEHRRAGRGYLVKFFENFNQAARPKIFALEKDFTYRQGEVSLKGKIDRVDETSDGLRLIDYKTGRTKELDYQTKRQLLLYHLAAEQNWGKKVTSLAFYYFESGGFLEFEAKPKDLEKIALEIKETSEAIARGEFLPNPGKLCAYCDFNKICEFRMV